MGLAHDADPSDDHGIYDPRGSGGADRDVEPAAAGGAGAGPADVGKIIDTLRGLADQEFNISERLSGKARQGFLLAAGVFTVSQTVAFGTFEASNLNTTEKQWIIALAIAAVVMLALSSYATLRSDSLFPSKDLRLEMLEDEINAAYAGDVDVLGRLAAAYLGVVRTRRQSNRDRSRWYRRARIFVMLSVFATITELVWSLIGRAN